MKNWLKTTVLSLLLAASFACNGQSVITQYIYEVQVYTNVIHEISNNVWTVSNITIRTQNEITQNVNRVYNYISTNFTLNISTNLYIDKVIGTNVVYEFKTNYYDIVILTNISTMVWTNILVTIPTNYDVTVNLSTNIYQTNHNTSVTYTYKTTINTNVIYNIITNEYADLVIGTNVVMEIRMTNGEEIVILTSNILSSAQASANAARTYADRSRGYSEDSYASSTNAYHNARDAMLYAYVTSETARRLATTNAVAFHTNSYNYVDIYGIEYENILALSCNDMNGAIEVSCLYTKENDYYLGSVVSHPSTAYTLRLTDSNGNNERYCDMFLSHCSQNDSGMKIYYLPTNTHSIIWSSSQSIYPEYIYWFSNTLYLSVYSGNIENPKSTDSRSVWTLGRTQFTSPQRWIEPWPDSFGRNANDSEVSFRNQNTSRSMTKKSGSSGKPPNTVKIKTSYGSSEESKIYISSFPTLYQWKIMWLESLQLGTQIR